MTSLLSRLFIKNRENYGDADVRRAYGTLCGALGVVLNVVLFGMKYFAGLISGSVAISADAFNNLSDAGSSLITLLGFRLAGKKPDPGHPFGHGRIEYISGLAVSLMIILMGVELIRSSVEKIRFPQPVETGWLPLAILLLSMVIKLYMAFYNRRIGKKIDSAAMAATAADSLSDCVSTALVLLCALFTRFSGINVDPYAGLLVSVFIIWAGIGAARDTISPLLGQAPDPEFVDGICRLVMSYPEAAGFHDLIVHDYGPGRRMISLHVEVDGKGDIFALHDAIDNMEMDLKRSFGCLATIHMDPINTDDRAVALTRSAVSETVTEIDPRITIHDFRMVSGDTHTNVIFDAVLPYDVGMGEEEAAEKIRSAVSGRLPGHYAVVTIDRPYN